MIGEGAKSYAAENGSRQVAGFRDYVRIARLDHVTKHIFILPGFILAYVLRGVHSPDLWLTVACGLVAALTIASANYVINEYLDREFDRHHPTKSSRTSVQIAMDPTIVWLEWAALVAVGVFAAYQVSAIMLVVALLFACQGLVYNVAPLRTKDVAYLDVISESVNNPFRLMIGWAMVDPFTIPPASLILAYWLGGAFLMGSKRLSEYREIVASHGKHLLQRYRKSFFAYDEIKLASSCLLYALLSMGSLAIFLIKYRIEYILVMPLIALLFAKYLSLSMAPKSVAQAPEKLYQEKGLVVIVALIALMFGLATVVDIPFLEALSSQHYISFR